MPGPIAVYKAGAYLIECSIDSEVTQAPRGVRRPSVAASRNFWVSRVHRRTVQPQPSVASSPEKVTESSLGVSESVKVRLRVLDTSTASRRANMSFKRRCNSSPPERAASEQKSVRVDDHGKAAFNMYHVQGESYAVRLILTA